MLTLVWLRGARRSACRTSPTLLGALAVAELRVLDLIVHRVGTQDHNLLVVASNAVEAKRKALEQANAQWFKPHRDALLEVDSCLPLGPIGGLHVHLLEGAHTGIACDSDYIVIS